MARTHFTATSKEKSAPKDPLVTLVGQLLYWLQSAAIVLACLLAQVWIVQNSDGAAEIILLCLSVLTEFGVLAGREAFSCLWRE